MVDVSCPWCEATLSVEFDAQPEGQTCPECLTSWAYEATDPAEVPLAA
jgi:hypothetical protein